MSAAEIARLLPGLFAESGSAFGLTMGAADGMLAAMHPFAHSARQSSARARVRRWPGSWSAFVNYTSDSEVRIWRLARADGAGSRCATRSCAIPPRRRRRQRSLLAHLDLYGCRPEMWIELTLPLWVEDATPLFPLIAGYWRIRAPIRAALADAPLTAAVGYWPDP
jgi:hypothetical protein